MSSSDNVDAFSFFPKPIKLLLQGFRSEVNHTVRRIIDHLDLVSKDDYLVQKQLLEKAQQEIKQLKEKVSSNDGIRS
ncbi:MAG: hypothetical protein VXW87_04100 [Pseudomonadota bacterium]|nr:hypothetical protein [Pseudomonadota bacterium]